ncbi:unnamed protein product [Phytophthora fragariaefolia]|uniref:Unnamed protein product n=1 Tax=Phytophthora fragariaefolia TaxID=1490495 RepID=A0A9W6X6L1_9STRA|nr:unnamed protein product [Phytophthora fragariaefolia]
MLRLRQLSVTPTISSEVLDRDQEIATLRASIVDRDRAYATLQGVATKHFTQLQESARLLTDGGGQPLRHAKEVVAHQRAVILRQKLSIARQGSIPVHDPHMAVAAAGGLDAPGLSPSDLQLNARFPASDDVCPDFEAGSPAEDVELDPLADVALTSTSPLGGVPDSGSFGSSVTTATSGSVAATSSTAVTTVVSAPPTLDPVVVGCSSSCELTTGSVTSNSAATAPGSALPVLVSISIPVGSAVDISSRSVAVPTVPAVDSAESVACTPISAAVPASVSGVVAASVITPDSSRAVASASSTTAVPSPLSSVATVAPVPGPAVSAESTSDSAAPLVLNAIPTTSSISTLDSVAIAHSVSSSAGASTSTPDSASVTITAPSSTRASTSIPNSAGVSATAPDSAGASMSTLNSPGASTSTLTSTGASASTPNSAGASASVPDSAGAPVSLSVSTVPAPTASDSIVTNVVTSSLAAPATSVSDPFVAAAPAVFHLLDCPQGNLPVGPTMMTRRLEFSRLVLGSLPRQPSPPFRLHQSMVSPSARPRRASDVNAARLSSHYLGELKVSDCVALVLGDSAESFSDSEAHGEGSSAQLLELSGGSSKTSRRVPLSARQSPPLVVSNLVALMCQYLGPKHVDDSSEDTDKIPIRDIVSRIQTGQTATRGKYQSYLLLERTPPSSPPASEPARAEPAQRPRSPLLGKRRAERQTPERNSKRKHKGKHKHRGSERVADASSVEDRGSSKKSKRSAPPDSADDSRPSKKSRRARSSLSPASSGSLPQPSVRTRLANLARSSTLMEKLDELWIKVRGEIPNSAGGGNSASLARDDHPLGISWICTLVSQVKRHYGTPSESASFCSYEEIAEMYAEWFKYKLNRQ